jgi:hypothetical protein
VSRFSSTIARVIAIVPNDPDGLALPRDTQGSRRMDLHEGFPLPLDGACRCGRITYRMTQVPKFSFACHCTDCQVFSASAFSMALAVADAGFELTGEPHVWTKTGSSGKPSHNYTCPDCATWTHTRPESAPGLTIVRPSTLADHSWFRPVGQIFTRSALAWALMPVQFSYATEFESPEPLEQAFAIGGIRPGSGTP